MSYPLIEINEDLNKSEEIADFMLFLMNEDREILPKLSLQEILLSKIRPGLNADILTSSIISRFSEIGIPSGPLVGGAPNVMEALIKVISEEIVDAIQNDMRVDVAIDAGMVVNSLGTNSGGPVNSVGASTSPHTGTGVAR